MTEKHCYNDAISEIRNTRDVEALLRALLGVAQAITAWSQLGLLCSTRSEVVARWLWDVKAMWPCRGWPQGADQVGPGPDKNPGFLLPDWKGAGCTLRCIWLTLPERLL